MSLFDRKDLDELIEKAKVPGTRPRSKRDMKRKEPKSARSIVMVLPGGLCIL